MQPRGGGGVTTGAAASTACYDAHLLAHAHMKEK
jgi:hypothetical protein